MSKKELRLKQIADAKAMQERKTIAKNGEFDISKMHKASNALMSVYNKKQRVRNQIEAKNEELKLQQQKAIDEFKAEQERRKMEAYIEEQRRNQVDESKLGNTFFVRVDSTN